ncbi:MAG TPA: hypothetical protein VFZ70_00280 [Euzebyales bacterium]
MVKMFDTEHRARHDDAQRLRHGRHAPLWLAQLHEHRRDERPRDDAQGVEVTPVGLDVGGQILSADRRDERVMGQPHHHDLEQSEHAQGEHPQRRQGCHTWKAMRRRRLLGGPAPGDGPSRSATVRRCGACCPLGLSWLVL